MSASARKLTSGTHPIVDQPNRSVCYACSSQPASSTTSPSNPHPRRHAPIATVLLAAVQLFFMSSLSLKAYPNLAFQEKPTTLGKLRNINIETYVLQTPLADGTGKVCDPLAIASPSFDWASDVEQEFYSGSSPELSTFNLNGRGDDSGSDSDSVIGSPEAVHFLSPRLSMSRESDYSLAMRPVQGGMGPDEGFGSRSPTTDSTDARGLLDLDRMFSSSRPPREYKVASVPSLCAIQECDEEPEDDFISASSGATSLDTDPTTSNSDFLIDAPAEYPGPVANDVDSLHSSLTCVANVDEGEKVPEADDPDPGWVWVEAEDVYGEAQAVPMRTKARRARFRAPSWFRHLCGLGGIWVSPR